MMKKFIATILCLFSSSAFSFISDNFNNYETFVKKVIVDGEKEYQHKCKVISQEVYSPFYTRTRFQTKINCGEHSIKIDSDSISKLPVRNVIFI
jgi:hypothetical protein